MGRGKEGKQSLIIQLVAFLTACLSANIGPSSLGLVSILSMKLSDVSRMIVCDRLLGVDVCRVVLGHCDVCLPVCIRSCGYPDLPAWV